MYAVIIREDKNVKYFSEDGYNVSVVEKNYKTQQPYMKPLKNGCQYLVGTAKEAVTMIELINETIEVVGVIKNDTNEYEDILQNKEDLYQRNVELANKEGREHKPNVVAQVYHLMYQLNKEQDSTSSTDVMVAETVQEYKPSPRYIIGNYHVKLVREGCAKYKSKVVQCADDAADIAWQYLSDRDRETLIVLLLDSQNTCIGINEVSMGSLTQSVTHPREVFKPAILSNAAAIILAHNHPSGSTNASKSDIEITEQMVKAGKILGIGVLDHVIVGYNTMRTSIKEEGRVNFD